MLDIECNTKRRLSMRLYVMTTNISGKEEVVGVGVADDD